ncbi:MAG: YiiX/YebB-like N1pC/P60 family cysteine hydrolase [Bacteroidia bacterium]
MKKLGNTVLLAVCFLTLLLCFFAGTIRSMVRHQAKVFSVIPPPNLLRNGDLILRQGNSFVSEVMKNFSLTEKKYSHAGIIHLEGGKVFVYHIIAVDNGKPSVMLKEPISLFCNSTDNSSYAVFRTNANPVDVDREATKLFASHPQFDTYFDLSTDSLLYCTELVYKVFEKACPNKKIIHLSNLKGHEFVACDNLYLGNDSKLIYSYSY